MSSVHSKSKGHRSTRDLQHCTVVFSQRVRKTSDTGVPSLGLIWRFTILKLNTRHIRKLLCLNWGGGQGRGRTKYFLLISLSDQINLFHHTLCVRARTRECVCVCARVFLLLMILPDVCCALITDKNRAFLTCVTLSPAVPGI